MDPIDSSPPVTTASRLRRRRVNAVLGGLAALALVATVLPLAGPADADPPAPVATGVYGQPDFTSNTANNGGISATSLRFPYGSAVDNAGTRYIPDTGNNRLLAYPPGSTTATRVYGQPNFASSSPFCGGANDAACLTAPADVLVDNAGIVYIADQGSNRVLAYPPGSTPTCEPPPLGMIGWWRGEDLTGEIGGNLTGTAPVGPGHAGQALSLNANTLNAPDLASVSTGVSVEGWIKPVNTGQTQALFSRWTWVGGDEDDSYALFLGVNSELLWITDETSTRSPVSLSASAPQLYDGQFHHVAATWNQAEMTIYVDGQLAATQRSQGGILNPGTATQFRLGSSSGIGSPLSYTGVLDEATVYDRALTAGEIAAIHTADTTGKCTTTTPPNQGTLWAWGNNSFGGLGDGTITDRNTPTQIGATAGWAIITAGYYHTCAVRTDGTLWCSGLNGNGQIGDGTTTDRLTPIRIGTDTNWATTTAGAFQTCAIRTDGTLWCWGNNFLGQLGDGTTTDRATPTQIGTDTNWATITGGYDHTCAVRTDSSLWCWGWNANGQLGDGTTADRNTPTQIGTDTNWATITAGVDHTCAVRTDGTLWCWGLNNLAQLGDGTTTDRATPTQIGTDTNWVTITGGGRHTCAVRNDGTLWCWGWNANGQLGDGTIADRNTPTQIGSAADWATITAGFHHTCAVRTDGALWCWGNNFYGQLGDGTTDNRTTPTQIGTDTNWVAITAGEYLTVGLRS